MWRVGTTRAFGSACHPWHLPVRQMTLALVEGHRLSSGGVIRVSGSGAHHVREFHAPALR